MKLCFFVVLCFASAVAFAQTPATVEGVISGILLDQVQVKDNKGASATVVLPADVTVTRRLSISVSDIHPGDWVGIDSKPGADGTQESVAINVFSPGMVPKVRKGQFPMASGDLMTNAPVEQLTPGPQGGIVLKNADSMAPFRIGARTEVHRLVDAAVSDLKPGMAVTIRGLTTETGAMRATFVSITP